MDFSHVRNCRDANEITRAHFDSLLVEPRYLDSVAPDTRMELFGRRFDTPVMIAAFSHLSGTHPGGMAEMARGAKDAHACNFAGMGDEDELSDILATGAQTIKIVKPYADRDMVMRRLLHAWKAGALAVGMDIDHSFSATGDPDDVLGMKMLPVTSQELRAFVAATPLPFVVKGVLSVRDAVKCRDAGVQGIVVSHHHGILPCAVPPLMALPRIRKAVGAEMKIFVDCGVDSGIDAFKALALCADGVCVGRALLADFHDRGAEGVRDMIGRMTAELRGMMARTGANDVKSIQTDCLWDGATGAPVAQSTYNI